MTIEIINQEIMEQEIQLNEHNKQEYPPMHSAESDHGTYVWLSTFKKYSHREKKE